MYSYGILVVLIAFLAKCLKRLTNARTPYVLVHMMAVHTAFDYELVTRGSSCTWLLCHLHFCFSPHGCSTESVRCLDRHWLHFLLDALDRHLWTPYTLKRTSSEATRPPSVRTTPPNNDFTALLYWEAKWPSTSSGSTVAIVSRAKAKMPTCLYCTDIRLIISFLVVWID